VKRLFLFVLRLGFIVALAIWLTDRPGTARIVWRDYVIETSAAFLGLCLLGGGFIFYMLFRFWRLLWNGPEMWRLRRKLDKMREGQRQLTEGLVAVAAGNAAEAGRFAVGARKALGVTPATQLLQAQAAQLVGDRRAAREIFTALAAEPDSAVLGYRGLIMEALRAGNRDEAERLVEKLRRLRPETPWLNLIRFELAARHRQWDEAAAALHQIGAARLMEPARAKQNQAAVLVALAQDEARQGHYDKALESAERAARDAPGWLPASFALAQQQLQAGHKRAASRTIEQAWEHTPHPQLAALYRRTADGDATETYRRIEHLCRGNEDEPANRLALAEAALEADIWGEARRHLMALIESNQATQTAYRLLARLERRESGDEKAALQWLTRATDAAPDPVWLCRMCGGSQQDAWQALCRHCNAFNALEWQVPGQSRMHDVDMAALPASLLAG